MYIRDSVEKTEEYTKAMEIIQPILDKEFPEVSLGVCHAVWARKKALLSEMGVEWNSPAEMNPDIIFD